MSESKIRSRVTSSDDESFSSMGSKRLSRLWWRVLRKTYGDIRSEEFKLIKKAYFINNFESGLHVYSTEE